MEPSAHHPQFLLPNLFRYSILQRNRKKLSQARNTTFDASSEHYQYQTSQAPEAAGQLDPESMDNGTNQRWSTNIMDMLNDQLSPGALARDLINLPIDGTDSLYQRQQQDLLVPPFTIPPELSYQPAAHAPLNYLPEIGANLAQDDRSSLSGSLVDGCTAMDWAELASITGAFAHTESVKPTEEFPRSGAFPSPHSLGEDEEVGDEDAEGDSDGEEDVQISPFYQNQIRSPVKPDDRNQKKVTMTLKDVEANLVEKVLALILSSNSKVDIKISTQE